MCGIFGVYGFSDKNLLKTAVRSMKHRGPDSEGFFTDDKLMLGVRRLSIRDLENGHQPLFNEDNSIVVIFNGELYNSDELRHNLEKEGHRFSTGTDTEVIVHSYEEYGIGCLSRFNGMFAFALWDSEKKKLFLARDRFGIKPLYYCRDNEGILFASEIKALLKYKEIKRELNDPVLGNYLRYRYVKSPETFIKGINKLRPGHYLEISKRIFSEKEYYFFSARPEKHPERSTINDIRNILEDSVEKRMISDVSIGLFLSGGLDSSILLHCLSRSSERPVQTFTIAFEGQRKTNEIDYAGKVSDYFGADHNPIMVGKEEFIKSIPKVVDHLEEPIADPTAVSTFLLSRYASKKVTVALTGEGADELFRGYVYYNNLRYYDMAAKNLLIRRAAYSAAHVIPEKWLNCLFNYPVGMGAEGKQRLKNLMSGKLDYSSAYESTISLFTDEQAGCLIKRPVSRNEMKKTNSFARANYYFLENDVKSWLPDYILARLDKMSMAHSVEARVPYLDHRLADKIARTSIRVNRINKGLLRKAVSKDLPSFIWKRKKFPFYTPVVDWADQGINEHFQNIMESSRLVEERYLDRAAVFRILDDFNRSRLVNSRKLWALMMLESCYRRFID
ncbi:asparagine synthase (glutamine-hydrolyzing) [Candidatus Woesearchaeota archaeon]|nr:asparagine synthase (glutamine-hydrolyzing) [Candidatus Woesearchaeota archaeon]